MDSGAFPPNCLVRFSYGFVQSGLVQSGLVQSFLVQSGLVN